MLLPFKRFNTLRRTARCKGLEEVTRTCLAGKLSSQAENPDKLKTISDKLFRKFKTDDAHLMSAGKFLESLRQKGVSKTDPRLAGVMDKLKRFYETSGREGKSPSTQKLTIEEFREAIAPNYHLISRAFSREFIIPDFEEFTKFIEYYYLQCKPFTDGKVADYIPQLARMNPNYWGVSVCTIDGQRFSIGDTDIPFTIQSTSKPLTYGIALDQLTPEEVHKYIGQEPSGRNFNELVLDHNNKPHNPMINAGAIVVCSLLKYLIHPEMSQAEKYDFTKQIFERMAGGEYIGFNNAVFLSEREAADRNYALGFYMRENKCFPPKAVLREVLDYYFQCCSMEASCESSAVIAATLANGGICPLTEDTVLKPDAVRDVLSLMHSCGMYDYSGQFAFKVGVPAKSGVSGAMMIVIPNVLGICSWSPALDKLGNSVRGLQFCESAITKLSLLSSQDTVKDSVMSILVQNSQLSHPELVRVFRAKKLKDVKERSTQTPFKKRARFHKGDPEGVDLINLMFASVDGDISALRMHWLAGTNMSRPDYDGRTALHLAAAEGHLECVKFLVEKCQVTHNPMDRWGYTPLSEAKNFKRTKVVDFLSAHEAGYKNSKTSSSTISEPSKEKPSPPTESTKDKSK